MGIIISLLLGALAGFLAGKIMHGGGGGRAVSQVQRAGNGIHPG